MALHLSARRWQDQLILLLGLWLFVSPWVIGFPGDAPQALNAMLAGALIAALAAFDLYRTHAWAVALNLLAGLWVLVSPWVPLLGDRGPLTASNIVVGIAVIVLGMWELRSDPELHRQWAGRGPA